MSFADILKFNSCFGLIVPLPVKLPMLGTNRLKLSARIPSGPKRTSDASV